MSESVSRLVSEIEIQLFSQSEKKSVPDSLDELFKVSVIQSAVGQ